MCGHACCFSPELAPRDRHSEDFPFWKWSDMIIAVFLRTLALVMKFRTWDYFFSTFELPLILPFLSRHCWWAIHLVFFSAKQAVILKNSEVGSSFHPRFRLNDNWKPRGPYKLHNTVTWKLSLYRHVSMVDFIVVVLRQVLTYVDQSGLKTHGDWLASASTSLSWN